MEAFKNKNKNNLQNSRPIFEELEERRLVDVDELGVPRLDFLVRRGGLVRASVRRSLACGCRRPGPACVRRRLCLDVILAVLNHLAENLSRDVGKRNRRLRSRVLDKGGQK